jgi:GTP-binding protein
VLTLADLPGYGHAVASGAQRKAWANMMRDYLQNRAILSRCCILVDCTRGLCRQDKLLVKFLTKVPCTSVGCIYVIFH